MLFQHFVKVLDHIFAALFGKSRDRNANNFSIIHGVEAEVRDANSLFDGRQLGGVEWLDGDELRFRSVHLRNLIQRHLGTVALDADGIHHVHGGAASTGGSHGLAKVFHCLIHARLELEVSVFEAWNRGHASLRHWGSVQKVILEPMNYKPCEKRTTTDSRGSGTPEQTKMSAEEAWERSRSSD